MGRALICIAVREIQACGYIRRSLVCYINVLLLVRNHEEETECSLSVGACLTFLAICCCSLIASKLVLM